jgi:hypothetical protein
VTVGKTEWSEKKIDERLGSTMEGSERLEEHGDGRNLRRSAAAGAVVEEDLILSLLLGLRSISLAGMILAPRRSIWRR